MSVPQLLCNLCEPPHEPRRVVAVLSCLFVAGCAAQSIDATLPKLSQLPGERSQIEASTQTVYALIASGAMRCWFAVNGPLKKTHIFHADVEPPSKGGAVEISILERDTAAEKPWGTRTFKILLKAVGDQSTIEVENLKMPDALAAEMRADVFQWAQGGAACNLRQIEITAPKPPEPAAATTANASVRSKAPP